MPPQTYRVRIARGAFEFEAEGDKKFVLEMLARFVDRSQPLTAPDSASAADVSVPEIPTKAVSVREFVHRLGLKKHTDITVAFGYFLEKFQGLPSFTPADINNCYYEAKIESSNTSQMLIQNIKRGLIMESKKAEKGGRKRFTLTASGEKFVESKLVDTGE